MTTANGHVRVPYRQVQALSNESFRVLELSGPQSGCSWHFHPEHQLGFVVRGAGERVVGDSVCPIRPGEVVLLGANLPHVWHYRGGGRDAEARAVVVHFSDDFLGGEFFSKPEMRDIRLLLARAKLGLQANGATRERAAAVLRGMPGHDGFQRVLDLLSLLHLLAGSRELTTLCSTDFHPLVVEVEIERLRRVCAFIQAHHGDPIGRDEAAAVAHLSPSAFSRFFRAHTGKTFRSFVTEVRVGQACRMLLEAEANVTEIALRCGFADGTSFDRSFRRTKGMSPTQYRRRVREATREAVAAPRAPG